MKQLAIVGWVLFVLALGSTGVLWWKLEARSEAQRAAVALADTVKAENVKMLARVDSLMADSARQRAENDSLITQVKQIVAGQRWWFNRAQERARANDSLLAQVTTFDEAVDLARLISAERDTLANEHAVCLDTLAECAEGAERMQGQLAERDSVIVDFRHVVIPRLTVALDSAIANQTGGPLINIDGLGRTLGLATVLVIAVKIAEWLIH